MSSIQVECLLTSCMRTSLLVISRASQLPRHRHLAWADMTQIYRRLCCLSGAAWGDKIFSQTAKNPIRSLWCQSSKWLQNCHHWCKTCLNSHIVWSELKNLFKVSHRQLFHILKMGQTIFCIKLPYISLHFLSLYATL